MKLVRQKPRHFGLSLAYRLNRWLPLRREQKLDILLDLEWIAWRLAHENSVHLGIHRLEHNGFLFDRIKPTDTVLDVGCGTGELAASIKAARVLGIDYDLSKISAAKRAFPKVEFAVGDASDFLAEKFDVMILSHVLEHLDDPVAALRLAGAARIYVEVPDFDADRLNRLRTARGRKLHYSDADHVFELTREEAETMFASAGLTVIAREFRGGVMRYWLTRSARVRSASPSSR